MRLRENHSVRLAGAPLLLSAMVCCASPSGGPPPAAPASGSAQASPLERGQPTSSEPAEARTTGTRPAEAPPASQGAAWLQDGRQPNGATSLPQVGIEHYGMHIGGESNAPEAKAPLLSALEARFDELLRCYRHVGTPLEAGSFGADLLIGRSGGAPEVRSTRQKLGSEALELCVRAALSRVDFPPRPRPVMVSYSFVYTVEDLTVGTQRP